MNEIIKSQNRTHQPVDLAVVTRKETGNRDSLLLSEFKTNFFRPRFLKSRTGLLARFSNKRISGSDTRRVIWFRTQKGVLRRGGEREDYHIVITLIPEGMHIQKAVQNLFGHIILGRGHTLETPKPFKTFKPQQAKYANAKLEKAPIRSFGPSFPPLGLFPYF